jgi:hypothetical protein
MIASMVWRCGTRRECDGMGSDPIGDMISDMREMIGRIGNRVVN